MVQANWNIELELHRCSRYQEVGLEQLWALGLLRLFS